MSAYVIPGLDLAVLAQLRNYRRQGEAESMNSGDQRGGVFVCYAAL
jgi:hypothetical protein